MRVDFVKRENGPERLEYCDAEIVFEDGPLSGMKLVGVKLWKSPEGDVYVKFSGAFGAAGDTKRVKAWILTEWEHWSAWSTAMQRSFSGNRVWREDRDDEE
jgi:hypothetical protein